MQQISTIQLITVAILPVLFAITVHEAAHGYMAKYHGDDTAEQNGRLTLNPIYHIDLIGTVLVPGLLILLSTPVIFGWAKPVPITYANLNKPKRDMALVALAGPSSNLIMALIWGLIAKLGMVFFANSLTGVAIFMMGQIGILINLGLMLLNLLPVPPLDGSKIVASFLSDENMQRFEQFGLYGFFILILMLFLGILQLILIPPFYILYHSILGLYSLPGLF
jgi:Zn-dependent protease